jgi:hypothetical protein
MDEPRKKLISLFEFLKDFNALRNPVVRSVGDQKFSIRLADIPKHPAIQIWSKAEENVPILRVARPTTSRGPDGHRGRHHHRWRRRDHGCSLRNFWTQWRDSYALVLTLLAPSRANYSLAHERTTTI